MDLHQNSQAQLDMVRLREPKAMSLRGVREKATPQEIQKAAQDFEAVFIGQMMGHMFKDVRPPEGMGGGHSEEMYKSLLVEEYGKALAGAGGIGVADYVEKQLMKMQEVGHGASR